MPVAGKQQRGMDYLLTSPAGGLPRGIWLASVGPLDKADIWSTPIDCLWENWFCVFLVIVHFTE